MNFKVSWKVRLVLSASLLMVLSLMLTACSVDVVEKYSRTSFKEVIGNRASEISDGAIKGFQINSKDGDLFGITYIKSNEEDMGTAGLEIFEIIDATPFLNAGLNVDGLDSKIVSYDSLANTLVIKKTLKNIKKKAFSDEKASTMSGLYDMLIEENRDLLGYHESLGHFGINFGDGFMFEWAKDKAGNDKDVVWVLGPDSLISAGVNPDSVSDWLYGKITEMDRNGKKIEVKKFIHGYNWE